MYYELYVDVLFLVNFMMDYLLLLLVRQILKRRVAGVWVLLGAALGALSTCIVFLLPIHSVFKFILFYLFVDTMMIVVGLKIRKIRDYIKAMLLLYIGAFFIGGVMGYFHQYLRGGSLFFVLAVLGYYLACGVWRFLEKHSRYEATFCEVEVYANGKMHIIHALVDTGNRLKDPVTGKAVSVVDETVTKTLFENQEMPYWYIPYHSVGKKNGILKTISIDRIHILGEREVWIDSPVLAISEESFAEQGEYHLILNPDLL